MKFLLKSSSLQRKLFLKNIFLHFLFLFPFLLSDYSFISGIPFCSCTYFYVSWWCCYWLVYCLPLYVCTFDLHMTISLFISTHFTLLLQYIGRDGGSNTHTANHEQLTLPTEPLNHIDVSAYFYTVETR